MELIARKVVPRAADVAYRALLVGATSYIGVYLFIALSRLSYPFELEWLEGASVVHVQRILAGRPLYVAPSLDFIPFAYAPLYYYVSAVVAHVTGIGFFPLRLVSLASSVGCFILIYLIVRRWTHSRSASLVATSLFAATFEIGGSWFDIGRIDSLFLVFLLAAMFTFESDRPWVRSFVSPVLLFLSFSTKQTALAMALGLSAAAVLTRRRYERVWFPIVFGLLAILSSLIADALTTGWYTHYVFELYPTHPLIPERLVSFWTADLIRPLAIAICVAAIPFLNLDEGSRRNGATIVRDICILSGLFAGAYFARIHEGSFSNVLIPAYTAIAIYFGVGWSSLLRVTRDAPRWRLAAVVVIALQFAGLAYWPPRELASATDRTEGDKLEQLIASFPGDVYLADHPWLTGRLNRATQPHEMAVRDVLRGPDADRWKTVLEGEMATAVAEEKYDAFIVDSPDFVLRAPNFEAHYRLVRSDLTGDALYPVTGRPDRKPAYLYVRRTAPPTLAGLSAPR